MTLLASLTTDLASLAASSRLRQLAPRNGLDFASNDYLGFASGGVLTDIAQQALDRGVQLGCGGSRLLRGNDPEHE